MRARRWLWVVRATAIATVRSHSSSNSHSSTKILRGTVAFSSSATFHLHRKITANNNNTRRATTTTTNTARTMTSKALSSSSSSTNNPSSSSSSTNPLLDRGFHNPLILGSGSFTRKLILSEMGVPFHLMVRPIDEKSIGGNLRSSCQSVEDASSLVELLAKAKADRIVRGILVDDAEDDRNEKLTLPPPASDDDDSWIVLTADQVVTLTTTTTTTTTGDDNDTTTTKTRILEKPTSVDEARRFVRSYAETAPRTVGAVVLTHLPTRIRVWGVDTAEIRFRPSVADGDLVGALLHDGAPVLQCAGGLMVEHPLVQEHVDGIVGTEDSVMGLSKDLVLNLLDELQQKVKNRETVS